MGIDTVDGMTKHRVLLGSLTGAVAAVAVAGVTFAEPFGPHRGRMGHREFGPGLFILCLLGLALVALAVATFVRSRSAGQAVPPSPSAPSPLASAETILAERLARGEISPDDYRAAVLALRETITTSPTPPAG